jgi:hypothetical protein
MHFFDAGEMNIRNGGKRSIPSKLMDNAIDTLTSANWLTMPGLVVLGLAGLFLLQGTWSGWRQGFPRKLANLVTLAVTSFGAWHFRGDIAGLLESRIQVPKLALELAVFFYAFLISYLVLLAIAYCVFKKTKDIKSAGIGYGVGGAILGFTTNLGIIALFALGSKYAYEFFHAWQQVEGEPSAAIHNPAEPKIKPVPRWVEYIGGALRFVNQSPLREMVSEIEPIDTRAFRIGSKLTFFTRNRQARYYFIQSPEARQLLNSPNFRKLLDDPKLIRLANQGQWQKLGNEKAVLDALSNPSAWEGIDLESLEHAIDRSIAESNGTAIPNKPSIPVIKPEPEQKFIPVLKKVKPGRVPKKNLSSVD